MFFLILWLLFFSSGVEAETKIIEDFNRYPVDAFPKWEAYPFQKGKAKSIYKIKEEAANQYLAALDDKDLSAPIFKNFNWDLNQYPYLKFRWRAQKLPPGASETSRATNDSACGVYVGFGSRFSGVAMKYVWSSTAPVGNVWEKDKGKFYIIVKQAGPASLGKWQHVSINVAEDYQKVFQKQDVKQPFGISVLTDGNAVHKAAACDYDDFTITNSP